MFDSNKSGWSAAGLAFLAIAAFACVIRLNAIRADRIEKEKAAAKLEARQLELEALKLELQALALDMQAQEATGRAKGLQEAAGKIMDFDIMGMNRRSRMEAPINFLQEHGFLGQDGHPGKISGTDHSVPAPD